MRTAYESLVELFVSKECQLLTTKQEYDDKHLVKQDKFRYVAKCGHEHEVRITNFMNNSGIYCKGCANVKWREGKNSPKKEKKKNISPKVKSEEVIAEKKKNVAPKVKSEKTVSIPSEPQPRKTIKEIIDLFTSTITDSSLIEWKLTPDKYGFSDVFVRDPNREEWLRLRLRYFTAERMKTEVQVLDESYLYICCES